MEREVVCSNRFRGSTANRLVDVWLRTVLLMPCASLVQYYVVRGVYSSV